MNKDMKAVRCTRCNSIGDVFYCADRDCPMVLTEFGLIGALSMHTTEIQNWLIYWRNADKVALDQINAFDQVNLARKYCPCLRTGVFSSDLVSDLQIWRALVALRKKEAVGLSWERADG